MSPEPQVIDIKRPRVRTEQTENADGNKLETRTGHLMSGADGNFPIDSLNQWEIDVLDKEMGRSAFQAWYRNPQRRQATPSRSSTRTLRASGAGCTPISSSSTVTARI